MDTLIYSPTKIKELRIYDVFHNDEGKLVVIIPIVKNNIPPTIKYKNMILNLKVCSHKLTWIFISEQTFSFEQNIEVTINDKIIKLNVSKYPEFKDEIIMSTLVLNEDNYIRQWISFHLRLGVTRFIVYDNSSGADGISYRSVEKQSNLKKVLEDYINKNIVVLIDWPYPKRLKNSGISGQTTQQNHSLYAFRNCKYIGLFDVDEYVNIQTKNSIDKFINGIIKTNELDLTNIGSFKLSNKNFYNPDKMPTHGEEFFKIYNCDKIKDKGKNFVIPKNVETYSVHEITNGKEMYSVDPKLGYINHYYFLNKSWCRTNAKGRPKHNTPTSHQRTKYTDDSIMRLI